MLMRKKFDLNFLNRILNNDWKTILYCLILGLIGFLAFILVLQDLTN